MSNTPRQRMERLSREWGDIAFQLTYVSLAHVGGPPEWQPAVNAYRCDALFVICVELAGLSAEDVQVLAEPRRLTIRGNRPPPEPTCDEEQPIQVLCWEIDHGQFERVVPLPVEVDPAKVAAEHRNGLLWIRLPLAAAASKVQPKP